MMPWLLQAPTFGYTHKVGSKTTFRILNKSWTAKYVQGKFKAMVRDDVPPRALLPSSGSSSN